MKIRQNLNLLCLSVLYVTAACVLTPSAYAQDNAIGRDNYIPTTISTEAQQRLASLYERKSYDWHAPSATDKAAWRIVRESAEALKKSSNEKAVRDNQVEVTSSLLGDVPVLDIRPQYWNRRHKVIVYLHGGGYVVYSPRSTLVLSAPICHATGLRVISVDYTLAPDADWRQIQAQALSVIKALLAEGYRMKDIALYGDSAGGGLVVATTLNLRDSGLGMPAAVVVLSPWVDLTDSGDTVHTLEASDPTLNYDNTMKSSALAYANNTPLTDPHVSPLYADFSKGFAPTMIIEGTKCILLSSSVRFYQALDTAHQPVKLDMYEGLWHVFEQNPMPESSIAIKKAADFINQHLT